MAIDEYIPTEYINDSIPAINASNLNKLENAVKSVTDEVIVIGSVTPVGSVIAYAGSPSPQGYLECNGNEYSRAVYDKLFAAIGTLYGSGNGSTTFNVPDLRGEFIRGLDAGKGVDENRVLGSSQEDAVKAHSHDNNKQYTTVLRSSDGAVRPVAYYNSNTADAQTGITGDTETRPRNIAMMYIIKT